MTTQSPLSRVGILRSLVAIVIAITACGRSKSSATPADSAEAGSLAGATARTSAAPATGAPSPATAMPSDTTPKCRLMGHWQKCSVDDRLIHAGLAPIELGRTHKTFLAPEGTRYSVGGAELQIYLYPNEKARRADTDLLDTVRVSPVNSSVGWQQTPTLVMSDNLVAILLGGSDRLIERVRDALSAGLPADEPAKR